TAGKGRGARAGDEGRERPAGDIGGAGGDPAAGRAAGAAHAGGTAHGRRDALSRGRGEDRADTAKVPAPPRHAQQAAAVRGHRRSSQQASYQDREERCLTAWTTLKPIARG